MSIRKKVLLIAGGTAAGMAVKHYGGKIWKLFPEPAQQKIYPPYQVAASLVGTAVEIGGALVKAVLERPFASLHPRRRSSRPLATPRRKRTPR